MHSYFIKQFLSKKENLAILQLIAWSSMDQRLKMTLPHQAGNVAVHPHMYAVELKKSAWLLHMLKSAES